MPHTRPNVSKSGLTISERRKSSRMLNNQRSMPTVVHKINSPNRLLGGTDEKPIDEEAPAIAPSESGQEVPNPSQSSPSPSTPLTPPSSPVEQFLEASAQLEQNSQNKQLLPASGPCCFCIPQTPGSVGDRKVDELIDYVRQNLEEAGKALATLGENFEHDLKLMFIDILGRIKQWSGIVQIKLDTCKNEVDNIRKELLARACEIDVKTRELKNLKAQIADYQNGLLSNSELLRKYPKGNELEQKREERREASIREDQPDVEDTVNDNKVNATKKAARITDREDEEDIQAGIAKEIEKVNARENAITRVNGEDEEGVRTTRIADRTDEENEKDEERAVDRTIKRTDEEEGESPRKRRDNEKKIKDATVQVVQKEEKTKRESELESEVRRLRKEYNRAMKERAEFESAIQRALLRGVSSLNVEALRVLRCPPIPCCTPCAPCPPTVQTIPPELIVSCPGKSTKRRSGSAAISSAMVSRDRNMQNDDQTANCTAKRPSAGPCCFVNRSRKSTDDGMVFLLHQDDAGNLAAPDEVCGTTIMKRIEIPPLPRFGV